MWGSEAFRRKGGLLVVQCNQISLGVDGMCYTLGVEAQPKCKRMD